MPAVLSPLQQLSFFSLVLRRGTVHSRDRHTDKKLVPRVINPARTWGLPLRLLLDHSALGQQCEESTRVLCWQLGHAVFLWVGGILCSLLEASASIIHPRGFCALHRPCTNCVCGKGPGRESAELLCDSPLPGLIHLSSLCCVLPSPILPFSPCLALLSFLLPLLLQFWVEHKASHMLSKCPAAELH